jgi:hypothetical protein
MIPEMTIQVEKFIFGGTRKNGQTEQGQPKSANRNQKSEIKLWL